MPAPAQALVQPDTRTVTIALEPVQIALNSLMLIQKEEHLSGLGDWVYNTREALTPAELENHRMVFEGMPYALFPKNRWPSFPAYLDRVEAMDAVALRDRLLDNYFDMPCMRDKPTPYKSYEEVLRSPESYVDFLTGRFGSEHLDPELEKQVYTYVVNPAAMKVLIVSHLRLMWDRYLAQELQRVEPMLIDSVAAFNKVNFKRKSDVEIVSFVTGRSLEDTEHFIEGKGYDSKRIILSPSAHIGPYVGMSHQGDALIILYGARLPEGTLMDAPDLSRNEIVVRLNALADDTRLRILHFIAKNGEQRSQDIMSELELSQSAASRHLKQLSATGYLNERRCESAKCYSLGEDRLRDTFEAVLAFLAVTP